MKGLREITREELDTVIARHRHWLMEDCEDWEDMRADLSNADLRGVDLSFADLHGADLHGTDLQTGNLQRANLQYADLRDVNLYGANLRNVGIRFADLHGANLSHADLSGASLCGAYLTEADLSGAKLPEGEEYRMGVVLVQPILGYKRTAEGIILTAEIPAGATVFCINGAKCRTDRAKIISTEGHAVLHSMYVRPRPCTAKGRKP